MLLFDLRAIGNKLLTFRKHNGMTQAEVAEIAGLSDRTYADIERGTVNMRIETFLQICQALRITPNQVLTEHMPLDELQQEVLMKKLTGCDLKERQTALQLLNIYLESLE